MVTFPISKINIGLYVTGKRSDGYHDIETVFYPTGLSDILEVVVEETIPAGTSRLEMSGIPVEGSAEDNLVTKAVQLFNERVPLPGLRICLHKCIPSGAGLGGGSSDGASMLRLLNQMFDNRLELNELAQMALRLGSDCPFFLNPEPSHATGRGEVLKPVPLSLKGYYLQLYHPGSGISTGMAYRHVRIAMPHPDFHRLAELPVEDWKGLVENVFEPYAFKELPVIRMIKDELYRHGAVYASMTGSGSAVYGLFREPTPPPPGLAPFLVWQEILRV